MAAGDTTHKELPGFRQFADLMAVAAEINGYAAGGGRHVVPASVLKNWSYRIQTDSEQLVRKANQPKEND